MPKKGGTKMVRINRRIIVFIMFLFIIAFVFSQEKQADPVEKLREEIMAVYQAKGEQGVRDFFKKRKNQITNKFIVDFAKAGAITVREEWLKVCEIMAEEKKNALILADVLVQKSEYLRLISNFKEAFDNLDNKILPIYLKFNDPGGQGMVYLEKVYVYFDINEMIKSLEMVNKAMPFFEKTGDRINQGNVYNKKGDIYFYTNDYLRALEMYDKALQFSCDRCFLGKGNVYFQKGQIHFYSGDNQRAFEMYNKALDFYKKAGYFIGQGNVYWRKGESYSYDGNKSMALKMYAKALYFFRKTRNLLGQGNVYKSKGNIYFYTSDNSKAFKMYTKALYFFEKAGDVFGQGNVYTSFGDIFFIKGENSQAAAMYDKALHFHEKAGSCINLGSLYLNKGNIYLYTGDNAKAFEMYNKALIFFEKIGEQRGQGHIHLLKGEIYFKVGDNSWAQRIYDKALLFFEKIGFSDGQGYVYLRKGDIDFRKGDNSKALKMNEKALHFFEKVGNKLGQGSVYLNIGDIYLKTANNSKALEMYEKALPFFEKNDSLLGQGNVYLSMGNFYIKNSDSSKAVYMYDKAINFYKKIGDIESESYALYLKANIVAPKGKKDEALALYEKTIFNLEEVREKTAFSEMKRSFLQNYYNHYEGAVLFMLENKLFEKGFKYSESMKARVFLDQMAEGMVPLEKGLKPELKAERDNLVGKLSALTRQLQETPGKEEKKLQELKEEYRRVESQFDELLIKIRLDNPLYAAVNYPQPVSVQALQKDVLKKGEILLRYFISPEKIYVFLVSQEKFKVVLLKSNEKEINSIVETYLRSLKENNAGHVRRYGNMVYQKLFKPLELGLKKAGEIIIIPDGQLAKIPFESLIIDRKKSSQPVYILEKYRVKYVQSASILSVLRTHYQRDRETNSFIGFGDPVYDYDNFKQGQPEQGSMKILATENTENTEDEIKDIHRSRYARAGGILDRLQASGQEVKSIADIFAQQSQKSIVYPREQASEDNAKAPQMKDFDFIHFACHGLLDGDFQSLVLSQIPGAKEDGYFTLNEIMNCDYNAKLVVLSACRTGSGKLERVEGVTGLTQAVMYAGTPAVVASLWDVDDIATKELMLNFYRNMLEKNLDKAEALRQAKLELIKNEKYRSPLFWSAFVMYGE
jgi:CHAT domain-containing protein/Tfp pilus assembly protein PilF